MKSALVILALLVVLGLTLCPMHYRVFSYQTQTIGTRYGFESRRGLFGEWRETAYGAASEEEADIWAGQQPRF